MLSQQHETANPMMRVLIDVRYYARHTIFTHDHNAMQKAKKKNKRCATNLSKRNFMGPLGTSKLYYSCWTTNWLKFRCRV